MCRWLEKQREKERETEKNEEEEEGEKQEKWERDTGVDNIATNYTSRSLTPRLLEETKENETRV